MGPVSSPVAAPTGPAPTAPTAPAPTGSGGTGDHTASERLIAYLGNWHACPSDEQISQYTHIVVGFAVTYKWAEVKNECSETCDISTPSGTLYYIVLLYYIHVFVCRFFV